MHWYYLPLLAWLSCGCATKQDYRMLSQDHREAIVQENAIVIDGTISEASSSSGSLRQRVLFFVPDLVTRNVHYELTMKVDSVVKGRESAKQLALKIRFPTEEEKKLLPNEQGIIWTGTRFRVGYDHRSGKHLANLCLVPTGNTPVLETMLEQARAASEPPK
jgi:hypothetical protein